jgi:hypothetical protein
MDPTATQVVQNETNRFDIPTNVQLSPPPNPELDHLDRRIAYWLASCDWLDDQAELDSYLLLAAAVSAAIADTKENP